MPIMKFNLNRLNLNGCHRHLNGCHRRKNLGAVPSSYGKENAYSGGFITVGNETMVSSGNVYSEGNYSVDNSGNIYADPSGAYSWLDMGNGYTALTTKSNPVGDAIYAIDNNGVGSSSSFFDIAGWINQAGQLIQTGANAYNKIVNSETSKQVQNILKNAGIISDNNSGTNKTVATVYPSTNYTPYILGGLGILALILILKR